MNRIEILTKLLEEKNVALVATEVELRVLDDNKIMLISKQGGAYNAAKTATEIKRAGILYAIKVMSEMLDEEEKKSGKIISPSINGNN